MTRPKDVLYILCDLPREKKTKKNKENEVGTIAEVLKLYLQQKGLWDEQTLRYTFGELQPIKKTVLPVNNYIPFKQRTAQTPSYTIVTRAASMWDTHREGAIARGTLLHELLGALATQEDIPQVLQQFLTEGRLTEPQCPLLEQQLHELTYDL